MESSEMLARRLEADTTCMGFLSEALERAVLNGDTDSEVVSGTPETDAAEVMARHDAGHRSDVETLTVNREE